jgi:transcriptional regulator with XRE-family HTH domain
MFNKLLKELREERGLTQKKLAEGLNITRSAISGYEMGRNEPDHEMLKRIATFFDVTTDYLIGKEKVRHDPLHPSNITLAANRIDGYDETLPLEARRQIRDFIEYIKHKYKKE